MDISTALNPSAYRILAANLVPGAIAGSSWVAFVCWPDIISQAFWARDGVLVPATVSLFVIALVLGHLCENLGSAIEVHWADRWLKKKAPRLADYWWCYLKLPREKEVIASGYLRAILFRFKFELAMIPAVSVASFGLVAGYVVGRVSAERALIGVAFGMCVVAWLLYEVRRGSVLLAQVRRVIVEGLRHSPG